MTTRPIFLSPHNDDETLFGAFTLLRHSPLVVVVFDSFVQADRGYGISADDRRAETKAACDELGVPVEFLGLPDNRVDPAAVKAALLRFRPALSDVFAPALESGGHEQHNLIGDLADEIFGASAVTHYMTYTRSGGKSSGLPVPYENDWIRRKLRALACYRSQIWHPSTAEHFIRDQREYYAHVD